MHSLAQAVEAAEERKLASISEANGNEPSINFTFEEQTRRIFSGFDIDFDEFLELAHRAGGFFAAMSLELGGKATHEAAWTEGLLVGLFAATLSDEE